MILIGFLAPSGLVPVSADSIGRAIKRQGSWTPSLANEIWGGIMGGVAGMVSGSIKGIVREQAGKGADLLQNNVKNAATSIDLSPPAHALVQRMIPPKVPHHPAVPPSAKT